MKKDSSLSEVNASIDTTKQIGFWKKMFSFFGPAYLIAVGYMDPGNWATDIAGGSQFGYSLLWVLVMSNVMALLLQSLSARLGLVRGLDLAQASRASYPPVVNYVNWFLAEIAIAACDLAEVIGMAIGLQLLFHIPLLAGVTITIADTLLILVLQRYGMRKMEAFILALITIIGIAFITELFFSKPDGAELLKGFVPTIQNNDALYIAIGIIGATVMPHNLYLHSSLVQTRKFDRSSKGIRNAIKFNFIDTSIALNMALFVNAAILILAASAFFSHGRFDVSDIQDAYHLLDNILGNKLAPALFAIALIAAGQSSTLTGTLSGQIVMEGYLNLRIQPWLRRLITRLVAIVPAFLVIYIYGERSTGDLLILSQVILSLQLGFAVIPLIHLTSDKKHMKEFAIKTPMKILSWTVAGIIVVLNIKLVIDTLSDWLRQSGNPRIIEFLVIPATLLTGILLLYIFIYPLLKRYREKHHSSPDGKPEGLSITVNEQYRKIAITVDFSKSDNKAISNAVMQGGKSAHYVLIHIVETAGAHLWKGESEDMESLQDKKNLEKYRSYLQEQGYSTTFILGYGNPKKAIPDIVNSSGCDLLVMGAHGHTGWKDLVLGTTLNKVRHRVHVPVLIVK